MGLSIGPAGKPPVTPGSSSTAGPAPAPAPGTETGTGAPTPTPTPTPDTTSQVRVPKGQLERTRAKLPEGWFNEGGHKGFKPATIEQVVDGVYLHAANATDVPRGRQ